MTDKLKERKINCILFFAGIVCILLFIIPLYTQSFLSSNSAYVEGRLTEITSRASGTLIHLYADENQEVKKGDLLLEIDPAPYEIKLRKLEAEIKSVKMKLDECAKSSGGSPLNEYPQSNYPEYARTYAQGSCINREKAKMEQCELGLTRNSSDKKSEEENKDETEEAKPNPDELSAHLRGLEAQAAETKLELSYTKVYAPQDGLVVSKNIKEGDYVETTESILSIIPKHVWVIADFKQTELLRAGQSAKIKLKSCPHKTFKGVIDTVPYSINPRTDYIPQSTGSSDIVTVKILFTEDYSEYDIPPGTPAEVKVKIR